MQAIKIAVQIEEDRIIHIHVPDDIPLGRAEVTMTIQPLELVEDDTEAFLNRLREAGVLTDAIRAPEGAVLLSDEELTRLGTLPPSARPSHELIDEDRGPR